MKDFCLIIPNSGCFEGDWNKKVRVLQNAAFQRLRPNENRKQNVGRDQHPPDDVIENVVITRIDLSYMDNSAMMAITLYG
ncbi:hypothetical protein EVAR_13046_1 [Eumeta japonica]|uniref:Uncharacterized protein n=1 Tax=Eumeta variegata TaxID=151549 RepID=A0A4C1VGG8_EUMVA|nr:hypothetical protein EVAR_13046_1 [Eumeta japonica]